MELQQARQLFNTLINKNWVVKGHSYNLYSLGWSFSGFDKSVRRLGVCKTRRKLIGLSERMTMLRTAEEVENTIVHEIAHALDTEIRGHSNHDWHWQSVAREIGHTGERLSEVSEEVRQNAYNWLGVCPTHGVIGGWVRKPSNSGFRCRRCKCNIEIIPNKQFEKVA